jgi:hypothetical protein
MAEIKLLHKLDYNSYIGDIYALEEFIECYEEGSILPCDGCIGSVILNGYETNIIIDGWNMLLRSKDEDIRYASDIASLRRIPGTKQIRWCNK